MLYSTRGYSLVPFELGGLPSDEDGLRGGTKTRVQSYPEKEEEGR